MRTNHGHTLDATPALAALDRLRAGLVEVGERAARRHAALDDAVARYLSARVAGELGEGVVTCVLDNSDGPMLNVEGEPGVWFEVEPDECRVLVPGECGHLAHWRGTRVWVDNGADGLVVGVVEAVEFNREVGVQLAVAIGPTWDVPIRVFVEDVEPIN